MLKISFFCFSLTFLLSSCGYRFSESGLLERYSTICIPFAEGDNDGCFTSALIRTLTSRKGIVYRTSGADLLLNVCLLEPEDTNIGFIYAPPDEGDNNASTLVVAHEGRLGLSARVSVIDRRTGNCVLGPMIIQSFQEYDFEPDLSNVDRHAFSLGQLEMHNLAQDAAFFPLYNLLAEKIVDYVVNGW